MSPERTDSPVLCARMPARAAKREDTDMHGTYRGRHRRHADPSELPPILAGLADLITVIEDTREDN